MPLIVHFAFVIIVLHWLCTFSLLDCYPWSLWLFTFM